MRTSAKTVGIIDLHFHGAFGIDLMSASASQLTELSHLLWKKGVAGFCPTTLSSPPRQLEHTVSQLGRWIRKGDHPGAIPLGIHLEGPFISSHACGAHPPSSVRNLDLDELEHLWEMSRETLKVLTVAPEGLPLVQLKKLIHWCTQREIYLLLGHSSATETQAKNAFDLGFKGVTHAWNALPFHHRNPGVLGAALGRPDVFLELIIDQIHVSPTVIEWTQKLHSDKLIYFISDCLSAGGIANNSRTQTGRLGDLEITLKEGACRLKNGELAGAGLLLPEAYCRWVEQRALKTQTPLKRNLLQTLHFVTTTPLQFLNIKAKSFILKKRQISWEIEGSHKIHVFPVDVSG